MKKSAHSSPVKKKVSKPKAVASTLAPLDPDISLNEENLAGEQFSVVGREDEASSSGHRIEPIINDEEGNAETLIEEGLHGYRHAISKKSRQ